MFIVFGRHFERSTALPCHILAPSPASSSVHGGLCPPMSYYIWAFLHCCVVAAQPQLRLIRTCTVSFLRQAQLRLIRTCCLVSLYCVVSQLRRIRTCCLVCYCVVSHLRRIRIFAFYRTCGTSASLRFIAPAAQPHLCVLSHLRHIRIFAYTIATAAHPHPCDSSHVRLIRHSHFPASSV